MAGELMSRVWGRRLSRRGLIASVLSAGAVVGTGITVPARYADRIYPGVVVLGQELGGLSTDDALDRVRAQIERYCARLVTFHYDDETWVAGAEELGIRVEWDDLSLSVLEHGRTNGPLGRYSTLMPWREDTPIPLPITLDLATLDRYLDDLNQRLATPFVDAVLSGAGPHTTIIPDRDGWRLDHEEARHMVERAARTLTQIDVEVPLIYGPAAITTADLEPARNAIHLFTSEPLQLTFEAETWTLSSRDLTRGVVIPQDSVAEEPWLDPWWLRELVAPIVDALRIAPVNATVAWDQGLYSLTPSQPGRAVDIDTLVDRVFAAATGDQRTVAVPVDVVTPVIDSQNLGALGITGLVARGDSSFAGSSADRAENVQVAANWISQTLIAPGETFSFNRALGPITSDRGYVEGRIILGDWYASDLGGGVCQVSTTVYRAALLAGLPFVEWHPHSARVAFYELDGWSAGVDAAIYQGDGWEMDVKFTNPTDSWMLLQMQNHGGRLVAHLFGGATGWDVRLSTPTFGPPIPAPAPVERMSSDLPPGARERSQVAQDGVEVTLKRTVKEGESVIRQDTFVSRYEPFPEVTLVGAAR